MSFVEDQAFASEVNGSFGVYRVTFRSEHDQVTAHLFERDGWLIAHVSFAPGIDAQTVSDGFWGELSTYADREGFKEKLQIRLS